MRKQWQYLALDNTCLIDLQISTQLDKLSCALLWQRGIRTAGAADRFFQPDLKDLHDPFAMKDMYVAVGRILQAIERQSSIMVYGDYDVDGVCAVAMFYGFLQKHHRGELRYYIPNRYREGYGISLDSIHYAHEKGVDLIIALDCGTRAVAQVALAKKMGMDVIICDHHLPCDEIPEAIAILNPQQAGCNYPFKTLCGCGVAFKFLQAVCITQEWAAGEYLSYLDLVATATACDIVPLLDENRVLVYFGLKRLEENARVGFRALIQISERSLPLRVSDLVFGLGPMINAAGRLGDAKESVRLLICTDVQEAQTQARHLQVQNENRKALDQQILNEAIGLLEKKALGNSIVLFDTRWHKGIVGIVASRLVERYHKPTIVLAESAGQAVGSARSVPGVDISSLIGKCDSLLTNYGGHKHAAGLTLPIENVPALQKKIEALLSEETIGDVIIYIAAHITLAEISFELYEKIQSFAPFGPSNRTPVFATEKVLLYGTPRLLKRSHLQFEIISTTGKRYRCIAFSQAHHLSILQEDSPFDICYTLMENNWNGIRSLQLNIKDIRRSEE